MRRVERDRTYCDYVGNSILFTDSRFYETLEGDDVFETFESLSQSPSVHKRLPTKASQLFTVTRCCSNEQMSDPFI